MLYHQYGRIVNRRDASDETCWDGSETVDLDILGIQLEAFLLVDEKFLDVLALVTLELDHLAHLRVIDDSAIAGYKPQIALALIIIRVLLSRWWGTSRREAKNASGGDDIPNFFLMTLRIFFWSNFFGSPWTVVKVLRPLRSICNDS